MKFAIVLFTVSLSVMVVMIFQAVSQEMNLRNLRKRMKENTEDVKWKEEAIVDVKSKIKEMKLSLTSINVKMDVLNRKREDSQKTSKELDKIVQACNAEKASAMKKSVEASNNISKLKANHAASEAQAMKEIQALKQQVLDRDEAICAFADMTQQEAQKLCGILGPPQ